MHPNFLLLGFDSLKLCDIINLCFDGHIHLMDAVVSATCVLIEVVLILAHVAATHLCVFLNKLLVEISVNFIVYYIEILN